MCARVCGGKGGHLIPSHLLCAPIPVFYAREQTLIQPNIQAACVCVCLCACVRACDAAPPPPPALSPQCPSIRLTQPCTHASRPSMEELITMSLSIRMRPRSVQGGHNGLDDGREMDDAAAGPPPPRPTAKQAFHIFCEGARSSGGTFRSHLTPC